VIFSVFWFFRVFLFFRKTVCVSERERQELLLFIFFLSPDLLFVLQREKEKTIVFLFVGSLAGRRYEFGAAGGAACCDVRSL